MANSIRQVAEQLLSEQQAGKSRDRRRELEYCMRWFCEFAESVDLDLDQPIAALEMSRDKLQQVKHYFLEVRKFRIITAVRPIRFVSDICDYALESGLIARSPFSKRWIPKVQKDSIRRARALPVTEIVRLVGALVMENLTDYVLMVMLLVLLDTGMRAGEIVRIRCSDVDLVNCKIRLRAKDARKRHLERHMRISKKTAIKICFYMQHIRRERNQDPDQSVLFLNRSGQPFTPSGLAVNLRKLGERVGLAKVGDKDTQVSPHTVRATFATLMIVLCYPNKGLVQDLMGHVDRASTEWYWRLTKAEFSAMATASMQDPEQLDRFVRMKFGLPDGYQLHRDATIVDNLNFIKTTPEEYAVFVQEFGAPQHIETVSSETVPTIDQDGPEVQHTSIQVPADIPQIDATSILQVVTDATAGLYELQRTLTPALLALLKIVKLNIEP